MSERKKHLKRLEEDHEVKRALIYKPDKKDRIPKFHTLSIVGKFPIRNNKPTRVVPVHLRLENLKKYEETDIYFDEKLKRGIHKRGTKKTGIREIEYTVFTIMINFNFNTKTLINMRVTELGERVAKMMRPHFLRGEMHLKTKFDDNDWVKGRGQVLWDVDWKNKSNKRGK